MKENTYVANVPRMVEIWANDSNTGLDPNSLSVGTRTKAYWTCSEGHEWLAPVCEVHRGRGCAVCRGLQIVRGVNDFKSLFPVESAMWHPTKNEKSPEELTSGSGKRVWFICERGHEFDTVLRRVKDGNWCRYCAGKDVWTGANDLSSSDPEIAYEWDYTKNYPLVPEEVSRGSNKSIWWICSINPEHTWKAKPNDRTKKVNPTGCPQCSVLGSRGQDDLYAYIVSELGFEEVIKNAKDVLPGRQELDVLIPRLGIAFEFHGLYFHSDGPRGSKISTAQKHQDCADAGIDLYIVWEDDWRDKNPIVKKWVSNLVGKSTQRRIGARKCDVVILDYKSVSSFLDLNHIQGTASGKHYVGLAHKDEIVAVAVFSSWGGGGTLRLERYATSANVQGGFSKIISWTDHNISYNTIETFADLTYSKGKLYESTGWVVDSILKPDYSYLQKKTRIHKFNFRIANFRDTLGADGSRAYLYEAGKTEKELAHMNGLFRVYDAGKIKYSRKNPAI